MDRIVPTEPPEEPVNRIAKFMEMAEFKKHGFGIPTQELSAHELATFIQLRKDRAEQMLKILKEKHATEPSDPTSVKSLIQLFFSLGDYYATTLFGDWFLQIAPDSDQEVENMVAEARARLKQ